MKNYWLINNLIRPKKIQSLFIGFDNLGKATCNFLLVENEKTDFNIKVKYSDLSIEEVFQKIDKNLPIILNIDGKGVVHKKVTIKSHSSLFHLALPNAKETDFYTQQYDINENTAFISVARKDTINKLLEQFNQYSFYVVELNLGIFQLEVLEPYFNRSNIQIQGTDIVFKDGKLEDLRPMFEVNQQNVDLTVSGETIQNTYIIPFASAVCYLNNFQPTTKTEPILLLKAEEYNYKKLFVVVGWFILITFLLVLLVNFSFYSHYNERLQQTTAELGQGDEMLKKIEILKQEISTRKKLSSNGNLSEKSCFSLYSDRLSAKMPSQIKLIELKECPLLGRAKDNSEMAFEKERIIIKGLTSSSSFINQWIKDMEKEQWVNKVDIVSYKMDKETNTGLFELSIQIKSKDVR